MREDLEAPRHPSDGGGRAWLEGEPVAQVGRPGRFTIHFEVGEHGIAEGGALFLQVSPFWGWSTPQVVEPGAVGYTTVHTDADGVTLDARTLDQQLLGLTVGGRPLAAGERITLVYGAGSAMASVDRFAERQSRLWIAVDGDGDGVRKLVADSPSVDVLPGPAARLVAFLPSTAHPGDTVNGRVSILDALGNAGVDVEATVHFRVAEDAEEGADEGKGRLAAPTPPVRLSVGDGGTAAFSLTVGDTGVLRLEATATLAADGRVLEATVNPMQVATRGSPILWGDLQTHSGYSDGTGLPEELLRYARDIARLDTVALTDHDHWGMLFLDQQPEMWQEMIDLVEQYHDPGSFVPILGYEWTNWVDGHRHVLFFDDDATVRRAPFEESVFSSVDPATDTPQELWDALRPLNRRVLTVAHHSAGGPIATDWSIPPDPEFEPVTEIVSVHGVSEALDSPSVIYRPVPGNFVRDALDRGYRLGFIGSSDGHDGHPGLAHLASPTGGLVAILTADPSREALYEALRQRRAYATSGPRIILRVTFGGHPMGSILSVGTQSVGSREKPPIPGIPPNTLVAQIHAPTAISHVDVIHGGPAGAALEKVPCDGESSCGFALEFSQGFPEPAPGEYLYIRVVQQDGGLGWSSPFFFVP